jgi:hypothetical protein
MKKTGDPIKYQDVGMTINMLMAKIKTAYSKIN